MRIYILYTGFQIELSEVGRMGLMVVIIGFNVVEYECLGLEQFSGIGVMVEM